jgi:hypothetical protein
MGTDPTGAVHAGLADGSQAAPRRVHDLNHVDAELYGLLKLRAVLWGEYLGTMATLSQELRAFAERMDEVDTERDRDFAEEVREKARMLGRAVPQRGDGLSTLYDRA